MSDSMTDQQTDQTDPGEQGATVRSIPINHEFFGDPSEDRFKKNEYKASVDGLESCVTCGRGVKVGRGFMVCVSGGGDVFIHPEDAQTEERVNRNAYMGFYAVGSTCVSAIPAEYRIPLTERFGSGSTAK